MKCKRLNIFVETYLFALYSLGVIFVTFLNNLLKFDKLVNPQSSEIDATDIEVFFNKYIAFSMRRMVRYSMADIPV